MTRISDDIRKWCNLCGGIIDSDDKAELRDLTDRIDSEMVELPKDTGGKYIHEHDKVDWLDHAGTWHENATVVAVCDDGCYVMDGTVFHVHKSNIRHHHEPTVVDVLRECCHKYHSLLIDDMNDAINGVERDYIAPDEIIAEYAAKLRLAEVVDE